MNQVSNQAIEERPVHIKTNSIDLEGNLNLPEHPTGVVIFVHGSGSSRHSSRNRYVASVLNQAGFCTLLFDLLTSDEETEDMQTGHLRFNIPFLAERLNDATHWLADHLDTSTLNIGYFGASTGAGAALVSASQHPEQIKAVVSRGGRPDMAHSALPYVNAPTLLIVGGRDTPVIDMNRKALDQLRVEKELEIIPNATHLFPEPGALEDVAKLAQGWFKRHL
ncbi:MAG: dienelactone hydrolase family protein [Elainellaceae cyanobacterium]